MDRGFSDKVGSAYSLESESYNILRVVSPWGAVDRPRRKRPPTYQGYLDAYLASRRTTGSDRRTLVATFGTHRRDGMTLVKTVPGRFAGEAMVFR